MKLLLKTVIASLSLASALSSTGAQTYQRMKVVTQGSHKSAVKIVRGVLLDIDGKPVLDIYGPDNSPAPKLRFRNKSGKRTGWTDEQGRAMPVISQRKLQAMANKMGEKYTKGDWIDATYAQIGLDERLMWPAVEANADGVVYTFKEAAPQAAAAAPAAPPIYVTQYLSKDDTPLKLEMVDAHMISVGKDRYIVGGLKNNSDRPYAHAHIAVTMLDKDDNPLGTLTDSVEDLRPGKSYEFRFTVTRQETANLRFKVTGD